MTEKFDIPDRVINILEKSIETVGKVKTEIELLAKDIQTLDKTLDDHSKDENSRFAKLQEEVKSMSEEVTKIVYLLKTSPFSKLADMQQQSDKYFSDIIKTAMTKLSSIQNIENKIISSIEEIKANFAESKEMKIEKIRGKLGIIGIIVAGLLALAGNIFLAIYK